MAADPRQPVDVEVLRAGAPIATKVGMDLQPGDEIRTGPENVAVVKTPEADLTVYENTVLRLGDKEAQTDTGKLEVFVRETMRAPAPGAVAGAEGTEFFVEVVNDEATFTVIEGRVTVSSPTGAFPRTSLGAREQLEVRAGRAGPSRTISDDEFDAYVDRQNEVQGAIGGKARLLVPSVVGLSEAAARSKVQAVGLRSERVPTIAGTGPLGSVAVQEPVAGARLASGKSVRLHVRVRAIVVPDVLGRPLAEAENTLRRTGLRATRGRESITGRYPPGHVNVQSPSPGTSVPEGETVRLEVEADSVVVPDLRGGTYARAESRARGQRVRVAKGSERYVAGLSAERVTSQNARPGERVPPNTVVRLDLEQPGIAVPRVVGRTQRSAQGDIARAGLQSGRVRREESTRYDAGVVVSQSPSAGEVVAPGTRVDLVVATNPPPPPVP
jgi:beta-lactam-binding protein with PASTA domain